MQSDDLISNLQLARLAPQTESWQDPLLTAFNELFIVVHVSNEGWSPPLGKVRADAKSRQVVVDQQDGSFVTGEAQLEPHGPLGDVQRGTPKAFGNLGDCRLTDPVRYSVAEKSSVRMETFKVIQSGLIDREPTSAQLSYSMRALRTAFFTTFRLHRGYLSTPRDDLEWLIVSEVLRACVNNYSWIALSVLPL